LLKFFTGAWKEKVGQTSTDFAGQVVLKKIKKGKIKKKSFKCFEGFSKIVPDFP
jgi:hypothetical protein